MIDLSYLPLIKIKSTLNKGDINKFYVNLKKINLFPLKFLPSTNNILFYPHLGVYLMNFSNLFNLQLMMFLEMIIGYVLKKKNIITEEGRKMLTTMVINIFLTANIVHSFCLEFSMDILKNCLAIILVSVAIQIMCVTMSATLYNRMEPRKKACFQYATVVSNSGFLGNPVAEGIYGSLGLLYASFYLIPTRIMMWSAGVSYFLNDGSKKTSKWAVVKKVATHPGIVAVYVGIPIMLFQIKLPGFIDKTLTSLSGAMTPLTMILIGAIMAGADLKTMVTRATMLFSLLRLVIIPGVVYIACTLLKLDPVVSGVAVLLAAMPAGSTTAILAAQYDGDAEFASKCVVLTTLLSVVMIPVWATLVGGF